MYESIHNLRQLGPNNRGTLQRVLSYQEIEGKEKADKIVKDAARIRFIGLGGLAEHAKTGRCDNHRLRPFILVNSFHIQSWNRESKNDERMSVFA